jgi:glutamate/tyrosine decarboxylase-like PLP-dependent enzyme
VPREYIRKLSSEGRSELDRLEAELDDLNTQIMVRVQHGGDAYISNATVRGKFALRACITNFRTTRADIDKTQEIIREAAVEVLRTAKGDGETGRNGDGGHGDAETQRRGDRSFWCDS